MRALPPVETKSSPTWQAIVRNPVDASNPPRPTEKREMRVWRAATLGAFLADTADDRLSAAWWLLATTGMRRGEALGLSWSDVELDACHADIVRTLVTADVQRNPKDCRAVARDAAALAAMTDRGWTSDRTRVTATQFLVWLSEHTGEHFGNFVEGRDPRLDMATLENVVATCDDDALILEDASLGAEDSEGRSAGSTRRGDGRIGPGSSKNGSRLTCDDAVVLSWGR